MKKDIIIEQGSTFEWLILVKDIDGIPLDMGGYTTGTSGARGQIRKAFSDASPTSSFDISILNNTGVLTAISAGECHLKAADIASLQPDTAGSCYLLVRLNADDSSAIAKGNYVYDIEVEDLTGYVVKIYNGSAIIRPEATKAVTP